MLENEQFTERELQTLLRELNAVLEKGVMGDVVELGCYKGMTSVRVQRVITAKAPNKRMYVYDSFAGLPAKTPADNSPAGTQFIAGELPASKKDVVRLFKQAGLPTPFIKKAWFNELMPMDLPDKIAFAFLDGDFYESIIDSLKLVWPKLTLGAVIVVDDYQNEALPGARKAVDEWLKTHSTTVKTEASLAILSPRL